MNDDCILVRKNDVTASDCEDILFDGINDEAEKAKALNPIHTFCFSIENNQKEFSGGINVIIYYGFLNEGIGKHSLSMKNWCTQLDLYLRVVKKTPKCIFYERGCDSLK